MSEQIKPNENKNITIDNKISDEKKIEENNNESTDIINQQLTEQEEKINRQLETLWTNGQKEMLSESRPINTNPSTHTNPPTSMHNTPPLYTDPTRPAVLPEVKQEEHADVPAVHIDHPITIQKTDDDKN